MTIIPVCVPGTILVLQHDTFLLMFPTVSRLDSPAFHMNAKHNSELTHAIVGAVIYPCQ